MKVSYLKDQRDASSKSFRPFFAPHAAPTTGTYPKEFWRQLFSTREAILDLWADPQCGTVGTFAQRLPYIRTLEYLRLSK